MTAAQKATRAKSAIAEKQSSTREIVWESPAGPVTFEGPALLPPTFMFDLAQLESRADADSSPFGAIFNLIESVIGEQIAQVRSSLTSSEDGGATELSDLLGVIVDAYGNTLGE